ncbi:MAG: T9SS type A sorting domain-containing protein [bacterium]
MRNAKSLFTTVLTGVLVSVVTAFAYSGGPLDGYAGDPPDFFNCTACHSSNPVNSGDGILQLLGLPTEYTPDSVYFVTISLYDAGQSRWGFELTSIFGDGSQAGAIEPLEPLTTQLSVGAGDVRDYLKQTSAGTFTGLGEAAWLFSWTAPPTQSGEATIYLTGNAANNNENTQGDYIYAVSTSITEQVLGVEEIVNPLPRSHLLLAAYPNPFNPDVTIQLANAPVGELSMQLFDLQGRLLQDRNIHSFQTDRLNVPLHLEFLPAGEYVLRVIHAQGVSILPLVKVK